VTFAAQDRAPDLWLEWNLVMLPAVVADDLKTLAHLVPGNCLLRAAFRASLRGHHIALVKYLLLLFGKKERFFALNASSLDVRHIQFLLNQ
jgi:hypothetical protein